MDRRLSLALAFAALTTTAAASAQVTFYPGEGFRGRGFTASGAIDDLSRLGRDGLDGRISSVMVDRGRWELCDAPYYQGRCVILTPGRYDTLHGLGMDNRIASVRPAEEPVGRRNEPVYEARVTSVRAIMGPPTQQCWVERQPVAASTSPNVPGALAGAVIGGILGHQVGGGSGRDLATAGGVVAGAVIGSKVGGGQQAAAQEVQRCESSVSGPPSHYDVTYDFRGRLHRAQMNAVPGATILVDANGQPRQ